jgi:hypothetical protein
MIGRRVNLKLEFVAKHAADYVVADNAFKPLLVTCYAFTGKGSRDKHGKPDEPAPHENLKARERQKNY